MDANTSTRKVRDAVQPLLLGCADCFPVVLWSSFTAIAWHMSTPQGALSRVRDLAANIAQNSRCSTTFAVPGSLGGQLWIQSNCESCSMRVTVQH